MAVTGAWWQKHGGSKQEFPQMLPALLAVGDGVANADQGSVASSNHGLPTDADGSVDTGVASRTPLCIAPEKWHTHLCSDPSPTPAKYRAQAQSCL